MPRNTSAQLGFPRFHGAVRNLIILSTAIYLLLLLAMSFVQAPYVQKLFDWTVLSPEHIKQGWVWQFLTYGFIHFGPLEFLFAMLAIYFLGSAVEDRIGSRRFYELFLMSLVGAGIVGFLLSFSKVIAQGGAAGSGPAA